MPLKKRPDGKFDTGRPLLYTYPKKMQEKIDAYFSSCTDDNGENPMTITGLALALGMSRQELCVYAEKGEFSDTIKRAKQRVEEQCEKRCIRRGNAGDIFMLKNYGWQDKTVQELTGANGGTISVSQELDIEKIKQLKEMLGA